MNALRRQKADGYDIVILTSRNMHTREDFQANDKTLWTSGFVSLGDGGIRAMLAGEARKSA